MFGWLFRNRIFLFLWAAMTGFLFAVVWKQYEQTIHETLTSYRITPSSFDYEWAFRTWLDSLGLASRPLLRQPSKDSPNAKVNAAEDKWLAEKVPVYCVILAKKPKQSKAVKNTWARHCQRALFYGDFDEKSVPVNRIKSSNEWNFLCEALHAAWTAYSSDLRWVLVVGDRTYAIVENLRYMVAGLDSNESYYFGHAYRDYDGQYNVADAGYVLSWGAMAAFGRRFPRARDCATSEYWHGGDRTLGHVLEQEGIRPRDTRDILERARFLPFNVEKHLIPGSISVFSRYWRESTSLSPEGSGCCSDFVITLSDVVGDKMYMLEYIVYHLKPVSHYWPPVERNLEAPKAKSAATTVKPKAVGKAFVAELSAVKPGSSGKKEVAKAGRRASPASMSRKGEPSSVEVITAREVSKTSSKMPSVKSSHNGNRSHDGAPAINNGHMNKVAEMAARKGDKGVVVESKGLASNKDKDLKDKLLKKYNEDEDYYNDSVRDNVI